MKMKRLFSLGVAFVWLFTALAGQASADPEPGTCAASGDGTAENPYVLCTAADLELLRTNPASHFELGADIVLPLGWVMIPSFSGVLDGKDHALSQLVSRNAMFGRLESGGEIKHLKLEQVQISSPHNEPSVNPAGLVTINSGTISHCFVSGTVGNRFSAALLASGNEGTIEYSRVSGGVGSSDGGAGGLVAGNSGLIRNSYSDAEVNGVYGAGGIAALNSGVIQDTEAHGNVHGFGTDVGGLVGRNEVSGVIERSNAYGDVNVYSYTKGYGLLTGTNLGQVIDSEGYGVLEVTDQDRPSTPKNVHQTDVSADSVSLSWDASRDGGGISGYDILQDGVIVGSTATTDYTVYGLQPSTAYTYTVMAKDNYGKISDPSAPLSVTTKSPTGELSTLFVKGINFNGAATTVEGNPWIAESEAGVTISSVQRIAGNHNLQPATDSGAMAMLNTAIVSSGTMNVSQPIANGYYEIVLWSAETDATNNRAARVKLEGKEASDSLIGSMPLNEWRKYGPFPVTVQDGILNLELTKETGEPSLSGMAIYSRSTPPPDTIAPTIPANVEVGAVFHHSFLLYWSESIDNVGVTGYDVLLNGEVVGTTTATSHAVIGLTPNTAYTVAVRAKDSSGNMSTSAPLAVTTLPPPLPPFYSGINFNGGAVAVDGNAWTAEANANVGLSSVKRHAGNIALQPATSNDKNAMLNTAVYSNQSFSIDQPVDVGTYEVVLWTTENYRANYRSFHVKMEGATVTDSPIGSMPLNEWRKYGPYTVRVTDGRLNVELVKVTGDPTLSGLAIFSHDILDTEAPTVPQNVSVTEATYTSVSLTWAESSDNLFVSGYDVLRDGIVIGSTGTNEYTVNGLTPNTTYTFTVQAKDAAGNISGPSIPLSATTNAGPGGGTPVFYKGINFNGNAVVVEGNAWLAESAANVSTSAPRRYAIHTALQPGADGDAITMLRNGVYSNDSFGINQPIANGDYEIYLWSVEDYKPNFRSFHVKLEGTQATTQPIGSMPLNEWRKHGPYSVTVTDGELNMELVKATGDPTIAGMSIYSK